MIANCCGVGENNKRQDTPALILPSHSQSRQEIEKANPRKFRAWIPPQITKTLKKTKLFQVSIWSSCKHRVNLGTAKHNYTDEFIVWDGQWAERMSVPVQSPGSVGVLPESAELSTWKPSVCTQPWPFFISYSRVAHCGDFRKCTWNVHSGTWKCAVLW